ncbi:fructoselysine 6-kinase [Lacrimispora saccharolytica]|uniref:PfkB domain protein n=1 Tax=Lacrimispora saccharolytica (strain ATCC 35040 / DSM 2544 / NRCC 2533 / WM1) TaxID=610130 RepID=D9R9L9_LACSW|nr:fructoselysine 6-kinase [Lacrimispora saccharolytica]ADL04069.1 PfkB domain protein [[Clostridium] saccharolyticum WM1]QRV21635.1 fructoselysine 6-kinase [Lacrimispora saccharolytica]
MKLAAVGDNCMDVYDNTGNAYPGGNPVNVAVYFVRLGGQASYTGVVGTDPYGVRMKEKISEKGVDVSHIRFMEGNTAITHVELVDGERIFGDYEEGVLAEFKLTEEEKDFICEHDMIVTGLWGNIHDDLAQLKERGIRIAFDAATRPEDPAAVAAVPSVDYLFFATDDGDTGELRKTMMELKEKGPGLVIATMGEKGSIAYDGTGFTTFGIVPCNVVDTMGAGDSFIAGFLKGILEGREVKECMRMGAANSSVTLEYNGAW